MDIFTLLKDGGFIMYPLAICSLVIWAIVFEKVWELTKFKMQLHSIFDKAQPLIVSKKIDEVRGLYLNAGKEIRIPVLELLDNLNSTPEKRETRVFRKLRQTQHSLRKFLWILGTMSASAPFIGLFGTVVGIIRSFESISLAGKGGFAVVAAGLSEALIATAAGIAVAVISVLFNNYFQTKVNTLYMELTHKIEDMSDSLI